MIVPVNVRILLMEVKFGTLIVRTVFDVTVHRLGVHVACVFEITELRFAREGVGLQPLEQGQVHASARERVLWSVGVAINQAWHKEALSEGLHLVRHGSWGRWDCSWLARTW